MFRVGVSAAFISVVSGCVRLWFCHIHIGAMIAIGRHPLEIALNTV